MNLSRCEMGHFYDREKYASCPHCSGGSASDDSLTTVFTEEMNGNAVATIPADEMTLPIGGTPIEDTPTVPLSQNPVPVPQPVPTFSTPVQDDDDDHTVAFYDDIFGNVTSEPAPAAVPQPAVQPQPVQAAPMVPVQPAASASQPARVSSPCVGWLIALGGTHIGQDFRLKTGKNFIGRDAQMDVSLTGDKSVSRQRHAVVVYEPKQHLYLVQPGESSELVYRNNEVVLNPAKLEAYDMLTVGEVNLLFMPLCGQKFNWSDLLEEMNRKKQN